ncbi:peptidoglycan-recognition protein LE isoform X1 [Microplitis demolitor]|uniref:peptidoglycan-recognition protein LE isoform X1 n=1 Tax=Microplitis demolitor TaxID=69319 RepID=UPI0004CD8DC4|nr:peptidoglycan-recognition protein LE isoform X1 [Microplitis demolitor]XP_008549724.1 peptidoglycan-recognition protein LE isoform X1 [Microplitis demolitor]
MVTLQTEEFRRKDDHRIELIDGNRDNNNVKENECCGNNDNSNGEIGNNNDNDNNNGNDNDNDNDKTRDDLNNKTTRPSYWCSSTGESSNESSLNSNDCDDDHVANIQDRYDDRIFYDEEDYEDEAEEDDDKFDVEEAENVISEMGGWPANGVQKQKIQHETITGQVLPTLDTTTFGEVSISGSTNVRVGNTTLYKGPVTIKQFLYTNSSVDKDLGNGQVQNDLQSHQSDSGLKNVNLTIDGSPPVPIQRDHHRVKEWLWTWRCATIFSIVTLIAVTTIVVVSVELAKEPIHLSHKPAIDPDDILTENIRFVQRVEWGAQPPEGSPEQLDIIPAPYVIISHTASESCFKQADCVQRVRLAQTMHIEGNGWDDIGYNFLIGGDGLVYVGRGWDTVGAHSFGFNRKSIGISFIGTFNKEIPPRRQVYALEKLIEVGVKNGKIDSNYKLLAHRQVSETLSPGDVLFGIIKAMDHWSEKP